uniref:Uncharacterized protein n=1 Tax=Salix viminalis TaxID=40686 RepID=A0A6N2N9E3_SALVM
MGIVERIAQPPTKPEVRGNVNAAVLENPVRLHVRRINRSAGNQNLNTNRDSSSNNVRLSSPLLKLKPERDGEYCKKEEKYAHTLPSGIDFHRPIQARDYPTDISPE